MMVIQGDANLAPDGILQGWGWSPQQPGRRIEVEVRINDKAVSTVVASGYREDLCDRNVGDGYHGFLVTLSRSIREAGDDLMISCHERESGICFWRRVQGGFDWQREFAERLAEVRGRLSTLAGGGCCRPADIPADRRMSTELGSLGEHLSSVPVGLGSPAGPVSRAIAKLTKRIAPAVLDIRQRPDVTVAVIAGPLHDDFMGRISSLQAALGAHNASLLVIDRGVNAQFALLPSLFANLAYVYCPSGGLAALLSQVLEHAVGDMLVVCVNPAGPELDAVGSLAHSLPSEAQLYVRLQSAQLSAWVSLDPGSWPVTTVPGLAPGFLLAGTRQVLGKIRDALTEEGGETGWDDLDVAVHARRLGVGLSILVPSGLHRH